MEEKKKRKIRKLPGISDFVSMIGPVLEDENKALREELELRNKDILKLKAEIYDLERQEGY